MVSGRHLGWAGALAALALSAFAVARSVPADEVAQRKLELLDVVVKVDTATATGSGTVIHSGADGTFVLTCHHVLPDPGAADRSVRILSWIWEDGADAAVPLVQEVEVVADDEAKDLALLKVRDPEWRTRHVATLLPEGGRLEPTEPAFVVGAGLGERVFATAGLVSLAYVAPDAAGGSAMALLSAPAVEGDSGGGAFVVRDGRHVLAGVTAEIENVAPLGGLVPVGHMALAIAMGEVRAFLRRAGHADWTAASGGLPSRSAGNRGAKP